MVKGPFARRNTALGVGIAWLFFAGLVAANYFRGVLELLQGGNTVFLAFLQDAASYRSLLLLWVFCAALLALTIAVLPREGAFSWRISTLILAGAFAGFLGLSYLVTRFLPFGREAWSRAVQAGFGAILGLALAWLCGEALARLFKWQWDNALEHVLFPFALGAGLIGMLSLAAAASGLYTAGNIRIAMIVGLVLLSAGLIFRPVVLNRGRVSLSWLVSVRINLTRYDRLWIGIILVTLLIALIGAMAPEKEYDALWYHLWLPQQWMEAGRVVDIPNEFISLYPLTSELFLNSAGVWGGPVAAKLLEFCFYLLTGLGIFLFVRRFLPSDPAWLAVLLWLSAPTVLWEAATAYNDAALAFFSLLAIYACFRFLQHQQMQWYFLTAVLLGLALAIKHLGLFWLALTGLTMFGGLWWQGRDFRRAARFVVGLGLLALLIPLPWYIRSTAASGNPFFPEMYKLFGAFPPTRWDSLTEAGLDAFKLRFGYPRTLLNSLLLPWHITVHGERFGGSLGPTFLLLGPLLLLKLKKNAAAWGAAFLSASYLALWASPLSSFQLRFLVPVAPLLACLGAAGFGDGITWFTAKRLPGFRVLLSVFVMLFILGSLPPFTVLEEDGRDDVVGRMTHVTREVPIRVVVGLESQEQYLSRSVDTYAAWQYINTNLDPAAMVLAFPGGDQLYSQRRRISADAIISRAAVWGAQAGQESQALAALQRLGITHILFSRRGLDREDQSSLAIASQEFTRTCLEPVYADRRSLVYRLSCP